MYICMHRTILTIMFFRARRISGMNQWIILGFPCTLISLNDFEIERDLRVCVLYGITMYSARNLLSRTNVFLMYFCMNTVIILLEYEF